MRDRQRRKDGNTRRGEGVRRTLGRILLALGFVGVAGFAWLWFAPCWLGGCAPVSDLESYQIEGSQLLDVEGEPFGTLATVNRQVVSLDSLPPHLPQAFLAIEDQRFYEHSGVDWRRMGGAFVSTVRSLVGRGGGLEGGSTITMQLARNLFPERLPYTERSLRRKILEIRIARQIEREFSKDKILELYVNHIYLGEGAYGVEAAAQTYFGKPAVELTLAEAAVLAAIPVAPSRANPKQDDEWNRERSDLVLRQMADAGYITEAEAAEAIEQSVEVVSGARDEEGVESSYFIEQVRRELEERIGDRFYTDGLQIYTTLDRDAQAAAQEELTRQLRAIEGGRYGAFPHPTYAETDGVAEGAGMTPYLQGAVVVMDASTGAVRAMVGGRDFGDSKFNRATQALRQPGSAFKPFVYLTALERFRSPIHTVEDAPIQLALSGGRTWEPRNYTGRYDGLMTIRDALTRSKNTATVRLAQEVGMESVIRTAREMGIDSEIPNYPSSALGAAAVRPIDLVSAYAPFANGGAAVEPFVVRRIEDRAGAVLWEADPVREQVLDPAVAFVLTSMLRDVVERGTGTAARAAGFGGAAAGKTGTTNNAADVWFIGYTPELVGGVWIGMDDPQTILRGATGGTLAAPVWGRIMSRIYADRAAPPAWQPPSGVVTAEVERGTGLVVGEWCPAQGPTYTEYFVDSPPPRGTCRRDDRYDRVYADAGWWGDEEWDTTGYMTDTLPVYTDTMGGIDWPELEAMRREQDDTLPEEERDTLPAADTSIILPRDTAAQIDTVPDEPPELLGEPVWDTIGTAPPDPRSPGAPRLR